MLKDGFQIIKYTRNLFIYVLIYVSKQFTFLLLKRNMILTSHIFNKSSLESASKYRNTFDRKAMTFLNIVVLFLLIKLAPSDIDRGLSWGFPGGYFSYGDRNNDGKIDEEDITNIGNLAWLTIWNDLMKDRNGSDLGITDIPITRNQFIKLLKFQGILRVTSK